MFMQLRAQSYVLFKLRVMVGQQILLWYLACLSLMEVSSSCLLILRMLRPLLLSVYGIKLVGAGAMAYGYKFHPLYSALSHIREYIEYVSQLILALIIL